MRMPSKHQITSVNLIFQVLAAIAGKSNGGTFYDVKDGENLSVHFSALLAGLLSVVVQDLELTVCDQPGHSKIEPGAVDAGSYGKKETDDRDGGRSATSTAAKCAR